jgi:myo-inositol-1(or 4)-monophosphatase
LVAASSDLEEFATGIVREAGEMALASFHARDELAIELKDRLDFVTRVDREVETFLHASIKKRYPQDGVIGEEGARDSTSSGRTWVIDPIDGTLNFVRGNDAWAISVGVLESGKAALGVLYAPVRGELWSGGRNVPVRLNGHRVPPPETGGGRDQVVGIGFGANTGIDEQLGAIQFVLQSGHDVSPPGRVQRDIDDANARTA